MKQQKDFFADEYRAYYDALELTPAQKCGLIRHTATVGRREQRSRERAWYRFAGCVAAVLAVAMLFGGISLAGVFRGSGNSFVLTANAAELSKARFVNLGKMENAGGGGGFDIDNDRVVQSFELTEGVELPLLCEGENIQTITYTFNGNGYFNIKSTAEGVSGKTAYNSTYGASYSDDLDEVVTSYTVDYAHQKDCRSVVNFTRSETGGAYCRQITEGITYDEKTDQFELPLDTEQYFAALFTQSNTDTVNVTVTYTDGSTETQTLVFELKATPSVIINDDTGEEIPATHLEMEVRLK